MGRWEDGCWCGQCNETPINIRLDIRMSQASDELSTDCLMASAISSSSFLASSFIRFNRFSSARLLSFLAHASWPASEKSYHKRNGEIKFSYF